MAKRRESVNISHGLLVGSESDRVPPSKKVGLDPGKRNVATMIDEDGVSLRYTSRQRRFESKLCRHENVLKKEKEAAGVTELEEKLSKHSSRTNNPDQFIKYLEAKRDFD